MRAFAFAVCLVACSGQQKKTCTPEAREALIVLYDQASGRVINSGACDKFQKVEDCPQYRVIEEHFALAEKAMCAR